MNQQRLLEYLEETIDTFTQQLHLIRDLKPKLLYQIKYNTFKWNQTFHQIEIDTTEELIGKTGAYNKGSIRFRVFASTQKPRSWGGNTPEEKEHWMTIEINAISSVTLITDPSVLPLYISYPYTSLEYAQALKKGCQI